MTVEPYHLFLYKFAHVASGPYFPQGRNSKQPSQSIAPRPRDIDMSDHFNGQQKTLLPLPYPRSNLAWSGGPQLDLPVPVLSQLKLTCSGLELTQQ